MYFNSRKLGNPVREFVLWIDCMGTQCFMQRSVSTAANFIFKFQCCVSDVCSTKSGVSVYPVMDGVYITSGESSTILSVANEIMYAMAKQFLDEKNAAFRYMIRGAIAYGDVYHGAAVSWYAFDKLGKRGTLKKESILLGAPVIQAYKTEGIAPPFGIAIHPTSRLDPNRDPRLCHEWYAWDMKSTSIAIADLKTAVTEYFSEYKKQTAYSGYDDTSISKHEKAFDQYMSLMERI